jgi:hypothetical protein
LIPPVLVVWPAIVERIGTALRAATRKALAVGISIVLVLAVVGSQQLLLGTLNVTHVHPEQATMIHDLAAMSPCESRPLQSRCLSP